MTGSVTELELGDQAVKADSYPEERHEVKMIKTSFFKSSLSCQKKQDTLRLYAISRISLNELA